MKILDDDIKRTPKEASYYADNLGNEFDNEDEFVVECSNEYDLIEYVVTTNIEMMKYIESNGLPLCEFMTAEDIMNFLRNK